MDKQCKDCTELNTYVDVLTILNGMTIEDSYDSFEERQLSYIHLHLR